MTISITKEFKAVNNKTLLTEVTKNMDDCVQQIGTSWNSESHRETVADLIDDWMMNLVDEGKIEQYKVLCDHRNNTTKAMESGVYKLDVQYKQKHCFNVTKVIYTIRMSVDKRDNLLKNLGII